MPNLCLMIDMEEVPEQRGKHQLGVAACAASCDSTLLQNDPCFWCLLWLAGPEEAEGV
jgi:hypothetical protein